jgi:phosphomannomutase/phosphoglucomutase
MNNPFKAYDVRGIFNKEFFAEDFFKIALAYSGLIKQKSCIAYDSRTSSPILKESFINGFISGGNDIIDLGMLPTPVSNYYALNHKIENVMITGSHTPKEYNGIKFFDKRGVVYNDRLKIIEKKYLEGDYKRANFEELGKKSHDNNAINEYIENIKSRIKLQKTMKIVLDHGNGASGLAAPELMKELGCKVINISLEPDGLFPNREPEPCADNLKFLQKRVIEEKADFGCAFDGDADRSVFVDNKGRVIDGSRMTAIFAKYYLEKNRNAYIVASIDMSSVVKKVVEDNDGIIVWCPVGMKNIEKGLVDNKGMMAGEVSSHFYLNDFYPFSDGILACAKIAEILSQSKKSFFELLELLPNYFIRHSKYSCPSHEKKFQAFGRIKKELSREYRVNDCDGIKFFLNQTDWVLIRPSNTEPLIRLTVEASKQKELDDLFGRFEVLIKKFINNEK